ncbi:hypothetical protein NLX85_18015 [Micromonospora sp. A3M-1-15]|uniref:tetratricopeptide repeat protein n=1 Tax=Micromonospora sp. A3M-1-15 TaxID=2962035 RepID=UPI0020B70418|nr:tetratricopeptide repeat protein [Micromonospora sp. A3M-1-15]MCP3785264.1 hypothetical protein [Micromonospora sp. A3M-1-15]
MGQLIDRPEWEEERGFAHRHLLDGLESHLSPQRYNLQFGGWFDDGRSGSPVARVLRHPPTEQLILKFCASGRRAEQLSLAQRPRNAFVKRHLAQLEGEVFSLGRSDAYATFMRVAGGNLEDYRSLAQLREENPARNDIKYRSIVKAVIGEWNDGGPKHVRRTVRSIVCGLVGRRRGNVIRWARTVHDLGSRVPLDFLTGARGRWVVKDLLVGKAHGDLSGRNILIRSKPKVRSNDFELIDYDHYSEDAPLARDPMHLLVALALDDFGRLQSDGPDLIRAIVDPYQARVSGRVAYFQEISRAVHDACVASFPTRAGLGNLWSPQCLLALVGVALLRVGRTITTADPEGARRWCYNLAAAAAERYCEQFGGTTSSGVPPTTGRREIIDRYFEQELLTHQLTYGPHGVLPVQGLSGVGKSKLVDTVITTLGPTVRSVRRHATPDYRFDVPTLIELISGEPASVAGGPGAALVRLEAVLRKARDPVVIAIESAEQLVDPDTRRLVDLGLDEAFTLLNTAEDHRVSVVLETPDEGLAAVGSHEEPVRLPGLDLDDFFDLLHDIDRGNRLRLDELSSDERHDLWQCTHGFPRIGELVYVTVRHTSLPLPALVRGLREHQGEARTYLIHALTDGMHPLLQRVIRALAAVGTPVPVQVMHDVLNDLQPDQVQQALWNLRDDHLLRHESELFFLPDADARAVLDHTPEPDRRRLSYTAAKALKRYAVPAPRTLADLRYHLAVVRALVAAGTFPLALRVMEDVDMLLRQWNCTPVLLLQRIAVRGRLGSPELEKINENALGGIYLAIGALTEANDAYECALNLAGADAEPHVLARLKTNLATANWQSNNVEKARAGHAEALLQATEANDAIARMGAMNGLADYHRRRGEYAEAIGRATEAFQIFRSLNFPGSRGADVEGRTLAVGLAVRLSRWHAEQADLEQAHVWLDEIRAITEHGDPWHRATYLDALADLQLFEGLPTGAVDGAIETAGRAVDLAFTVQDRATLLQARTTLCVAHLRAGRTSEAATSITRAGWHRPRGRHLVVLGLEALTKRITDDPGAASDLFDDLREEAANRIAKDTGVRFTSGRLVEIGRADFGARHFQGFALCGLFLAGRATLESALTSFRMPELASPPRAQGLVDRMAFMLERLDETAPRPGALQPVIAALRDS